MASDKGRYRVYLAGYLGNHDSQHHAIYVDTDIVQGKRWGWLFHVTGNLLSGMTFEEKYAIYPLLSASGESIQQLGWISYNKFPEGIREVCEGIPPPKSQYTLASKRLFPNEPIRHCQHWVREAMDALFVAGVVEPLGPEEKGESETMKDDKIVLAD